MNQASSNLVEREVSEELYKKTFIYARQKSGLVMARSLSFRVRVRVRVGRGLLGRLPNLCCSGDS